MNSKASLAFTNLKPVLLGNNYVYPLKLGLDGFLVDSCGINSAEEKDSVERALIGPFRC